MKKTPEKKIKKSSRKLKEQTGQAIVRAKKKTKKVIFRSDKKEIDSLLKASRAGAEKAIREAKALGLTITFMENGILYSETADGKKTVISTSAKTPVRIRKGTIVHAKK